MEHVSKNLASLVFRVPGFISHPFEGASKNLALLVFSLHDFIFWLKEGVLSMSYMLFFATPSSRPPTHWVFRGALEFLEMRWSI
jgi:hypothetical protein